MNKIKLKKYFEVFVFVLILILFYLLYFKNSNLVINFSAKGIFAILLFILLIALNQFLKYIKFYLIIIKNKIKLNSYTNKYLKTTLVNIVIPYKLGEVYRFYEFGNVIGYKNSLFSIIIDRFFDILGLLIFVVPFEIINDKQLSVPTILFICGLLVLALIYLIFPFFYKFINLYLLKNGNSKKSLYALSTLEKCKEMHNIIKDRIYCRGIIILLISVCYWGVEFLALKVLETFSIVSISGFGIANYMNSFFYFLSGYKEYVVLYVISMLVLIFLIIIKRLIFYRKRGHN
jgi:hypothetical protein